MVNTTIFWAEHFVATHPVATSGPNIFGTIRWPGKKDSTRQANNNTRLITGRRKPSGGTGIHVHTCTLRLRLTSPSVHGPWCKYTQMMIMADDILTKCPVNGNKYSLKIK
ncbi:uncharacterized protein LOC141857367 [Brevipalpus obovatus]|uniref:uncharacterized protein LOC141857367 n=1 Tax=Brevipalpus obovatus TaxID=246614 RepID=UPI003D9F007D